MPVEPPFLESIKQAKTKITVKWKTIKHHVSRKIVKNVIFWQKWGNFQDFAYR